MRTMAIGQFAEPADAGKSSVRCREDIELGVTPHYIKLIVSGRNFAEVSQRRSGLLVTVHPEGHSLASGTPSRRVAPSQSAGSANESRFSGLSQGFLNQRPNLSSTEQIQGCQSTVWSPHRERDQITDGVRRHS